tara:strand:+ start:1684 stop:2295 length:612 start_codon:yes stop_codon:yes gene_type:complete
MSKEKLRETTLEEREKTIRFTWKGRQEGFDKSMETYDAVRTIAENEKENFFDIMEAYWAGGVDEHGIKNGGVFIKYGSLDTEFQFNVYDMNLFKTVVKEVRAIINRAAETWKTEPPSKVTWNLNDCTKISDDAAYADFSIDLEDDRWESVWKAPTWAKCYEIQVWFHPDDPPDFIVKDPQKCGWSEPEEKYYTPAPKWVCAVQ